MCGSLFGVSIYIASIPGVAQQYSTSTTLAISPITFYALGQSLGPIVAGGVCERYGRQIIYRVCVPLALIFTATTGISRNFQTIAVLRFLASFAIAPCGPAGIGVANDLTDTGSKVGSMFAITIAIMLALPASLGPIISLSVVSDRDWRWTFWTNTIFLGVVLLTTFWIPETYQPQMQKAQAKKRGEPYVQQDSAKTPLVELMARPVLMFVRDPIIFPTCLISAIAQSMAFFFFVAYPYIFQRLYSFNQHRVALAFLPILFGSLLGVPVIGYFDKNKYQKHVILATAEGTPVIPEMRLFPAMTGGIIMPISLFWYVPFPFQAVHLFNSPAGSHGHRSKVCIG